MMPLIIHIISAAEEPQYFRGDTTLKFISFQEVGRHLFLMKDSPYTAINYFQAQMGNNRFLWLQPLDSVLWQHCLQVEGVQHPTSGTTETYPKEHSRSLCISMPMKWDMTCRGDVPNWKPASMEYPSIMGPDYRKYGKICMWPHTTHKVADQGEGLPDIL